MKEIVTWGPSYGDYITFYTFSYPYFEGSSRLNGAMVHSAPSWWLIRILLYYSVCRAQKQAFPLRLSCLVRSWGLDYMDVSRLSKGYPNSLEAAVIKKNHKKYQFITFLPSFKRWRKVILDVQILLYKTEYEGTQISAKLSELIASQSLGLRTLSIIRNSSKLENTIFRKLGVFFSGEQRRHLLYWVP
jgi:hypothetical protein